MSDDAFTLTATQRRKVERRVERIIKKWIKSLGLNDWSFGVAYVDADDLEWAASIDPEWEYKQATLTINSREFLDSDDDAVESYLVHELVHCLLNPMSTIRHQRSTTRRSAAVELEEFVTTGITDALLRVRDMAAAGKA